MDTRKIKLTELRTLDGKLFKVGVEDENGLPVLTERKDKEGKIIMNNREPVYIPETRELKGDECLPELLKIMFKRIEHPTKQDIIYGTRMYDNIAKSPNGYLVLDDDVHKWIVTTCNKTYKVKSRDEEVAQEFGATVWGINYIIIENVLDSFERPHEKAS